MAVTSRLRVLYLTHLAKPSGDRILYRAIGHSRARTILELGLDSAERARRLIEVAAWHTPLEEVCYTGIDRFEARPSEEGPPLPLKTVYRILARSGARVRLCPGDPFSALSRVANSLPRADLVVVSRGVDRASLDRAWFYLPRLLHSGSQVFLEEEPAPGQTPGFRPLPTAQVEAMATAATRRRAA